MAIIAFAPASPAQQASSSAAASAQQIIPPASSAPAADTSSAAAAAKEPGTANGQQSSSPQPAAPQPSASTPSATETQEDRLTVNPITGLVTVSALHYTPLTNKQRLKIYWKQTYFSGGAYFKPLLFSLALDQATGSPRAWGGGFEGYGLRLASRTASGYISGTIRAPLAAVLHEDVRYVYSDRPGTWRRLLHATEYSFLTYNGEGHPTLNISKLVGYYSSTAISTTWHPPGHNVASYTFINGSEQLGLSVPFNLLQEFWPDITHKLKHGQ